MNPTDPLIIAATVEATKDVIPEVYKDGLQPTVQELGKNLQTISKVVTIALTPITAMVWSYEKIKERFIPKLEKKLENVPKENIVTPEPEIAVPAIEALRYTAHNDALSDMFSNLLATAMDISSASKAHPSFVEIIKQINSDEAKIIKSIAHDRNIPIVRIRLYDINSNIESYAQPLNNFSYTPYEVNCSYPELGPSYLENLERLGLVSLSYDVYKITQNAYDSVENHPILNEWRDKAPTLNKRFTIQRGALSLTAFGEKFIESCVLSK